MTDNSVTDNLVAIITLRVYHLPPVHCAMTLIGRKD